MLVDYPQMKNTMLHNFSAHAILHALLGILINQALSELKCAGKEWLHISQVFIGW